MAMAGVEGERRRKERKKETKVIIIVKVNVIVSQNTNNLTEKRIIVY